MESGSLAVIPYKGSSGDVKTTSFWQMFENRTLTNREVRRRRDKEKRTKNRGRGRGREDVGDDFTDRMGSCRSGFAMLNLHKKERNEKNRSSFLFNFLFFILNFLSLKITKPTTKLKQIHFFLSKNYQTHHKIEANQTWVIQLTLTNNINHPDSTL